MASKKYQSLADLAALCDLLSDSTRLHLVLLLAKGDSDVNRLCKVLKLSQPSVSHHLGLLRMNRLAIATRTGKKVIYSLADHVKSSGGKVRISLPPYSVTVEGR